MARPLSLMLLNLPQHGSELLKWIWGSWYSSNVEARNQVFNQWRWVFYPGSIDILNYSCNIKAFCIEALASTWNIWWNIFVLLLFYYGVLDLHLYNFLPLVRLTLFHLSNLLELNCSLSTDSWMQSQTPEPTYGLKLINLNAWSKVN